MGCKLDTRKSSMELLAKFEMAITKRKYQARTLVNAIIVDYFPPS